jgi:hypothetical protein
VGDTTWKAEDLVGEVFCSVSCRKGLGCDCSGCECRRLDQTDNRPVRAEPDREVEPVNTSMPRDKLVC